MAAVTMTREFSRGLVSARKSANAADARDKGAGISERLEDRPFSSMPAPSCAGSRPAQLRRNRLSDPHGNGCRALEPYAIGPQRQHERRRERQRPARHMRGVDGDVLRRPDDECAERDLSEDESRRARPQDGAAPGGSNGDRERALQWRRSRASRRPRPRGARNGSRSAASTEAGQSPPKTSGKSGMASPASEWRMVAPTMTCG